MAVRADDAIAGEHQPLLRQQRVFDAHAPHFEVIGKVLRAGEFTHQLGELRGFDIFIWRGVIGNQAHALAIEHLGGAHTREFANRQRRGDVIAQHKIQAAVDEFPRVHLGLSGVCGKNLLSDGHGHGCYTPNY